MDPGNYFLQPVEDSRIQKEVEGLKHSIDAHVYNYYSGITHPPSNDVILDIVNFDDKDWSAPKSLLSEEPFRLAAIRLTIASFMLERIAFDGDPSTTFLPPNVVSLLLMASSHHPEQGESCTG